MFRPMACALQGSEGRVSSSRSEDLYRSCGRVEAGLAFYRFGGARIRTRGENRMTGTTKHSPRTDLVELVALSRGARGEDLSAPLASLSLLSLSSDTKTRRP